MFLLVCLLMHLSKYHSMRDCTSGLTYTPVQFAYSEHKQTH